MSKAKKLNEAQPREQAGSRTAEQYEYQYCQVANECFGLFESSNNLCVFCEWHDDFVTEHRPNPNEIDIYAFTQVKTKSLKQGPWTVNEIFGIPRSGSSLKEDSAFFRMFQNYQLFRGHCRKFIFVTNSGINQDLTKLLDETAKSDLPEKLPKKQKEKFDKLWSLYKTHYTSGSESEFFQLIKRFEIQSESGKLGDHIDLLRIKIQDKVKEFCEFNLKSSEAKRISQNILDLVRKKSQKQINKTPLNEDELQSEKAIKAEDLLEYLALSKGGLRALQSGSADIRDNILALSRFHRLCKDSGIPDQYVEQMCNFKVKWDVWIQDKKLDFDESDYDLLKIECLEALSDKKTIKQLGDDAENITKKFNPKLPAHIQLDKSLVLGFLFSLASQMENSSDE